MTCQCSEHFKSLVRAYNWLETTLQSASRAWSGWRGSRPFDALILLCCRMIFALCCLNFAYAFRDFFRAVDRPGSTNFVSSPISWKRRSGVVAAEPETLTGRTGRDAGPAFRSPGETPRQHLAVLPVWLALLVCGAAGTIKRSSPRRMGCIDQN